MKGLFLAFFLFAAPFYAQTQNLRISITNVASYGNDGRFNLYGGQFKVLSGKIDADRVTLALPLPDGKKGFVWLETYGDKFSEGQSTRSEYGFKTIGCTLKNGQTLVSHDLAPVKTPAGSSFSFQTGTMFLGDTDHEFFGMVTQIKGLARVGDQVVYTNARGEKGRGTILALDVAGNYMTTDAMFEGLPEGTFGIRLRADTRVDFSDAVCVPDKGEKIPANNPSSVATTPTTRATIQHIPLNLTLEDKSVKITVHELVKYKPVAGEGLDIFKVDYSLDYYILDATFENKTAQPLDVGMYLLRFNFFSPDGKSADEFTRMFKAGASNGDDPQKNAEIVDKTVFGGSGKLVMANVLVKYQTSVPEYDSKYRPQTERLNKPLDPGQKVRSIDATIMGVQPSYTIQGLGTWNGTFFNAKNLLFVPLPAGFGAK